MVVTTILLGSSASADRWELVKREIDRRFPEVKKITTAELADLLRTKRNRPLLVDVRSKAEYEISHLRGALRVQPGSDPAKVPLPMRKDTPIVTYCSVGYRSAEFAQRLHAAGFTNVRNLEGSIFQWANEGRPIVRESRSVEQVHPYNKLWGTLLRKERRADVSAVH